MTGCANTRPHWNGSRGSSNPAKRPGILPSCRPSRPRTRRPWPGTGRAGRHLRSDLRLFTHHANIPAVLYGPGDVANAHTSTSMSS